MFTQESIIFLKSNRYLRAIVLKSAMCFIEIFIDKARTDDLCLLQWIATAAFQTRKKNDFDIYSIWLKVTKCSSTFWRNSMPNFNCSLVKCFVNLRKHFEAWERKRYKCFFSYIRLDLFCSHPSIYKAILLVYWL